MSWQEPIKTALDEFNKVFRKVENGVLVVKDNPIIDTAIKSSLSAIPIAGPILRDWYDSVEGDDKQKITDIINFIESLMKLNKDQFLILLTEMEKNRDEIIKNKDMVIIEMKKAERLVIDKIQETRKEIIQNKQLLIQNLLRIDGVAVRVDNSSKEILSRLLEILEKIDPPIASSSNKNEINKILVFYKKLLGLLKITGNIFQVQLDRRDDLWNILEIKLPLEIKKYEYAQENETSFILFEKGFREIYPMMDKNDLDLYCFICQLTKNMSKYNSDILELLDDNYDYLIDMPELSKLHRHLSLWIAKFRNSENKPDVCLVYVGVEEGEPFPRGIESLIEERIKNLTSSFENMKNMI